MKAAPQGFALTVVSLQEIETRRHTDFYFGLMVSSAPLCRPLLVELH